MAENPERTYEFGSFRLEVLRQRLFAWDEPVPLAPKAFELLLVLVRSQARLVKKDDLMRTLWPDTVVEESNLTQNIFQVRKALGENAHDHRFIVTVPGQGYRFVAEVRQPEGPGRQESAVFGRLATPVAVVPFQVLGGAPGDEHLGLALADAVITRLSGLRGITMRPTGSVMRYATGVSDPLAAGRELGADTLVHGAVLRVGQGLRITVQIVNLPAAAVMWAGTIDQPSANLFAAQDALCEQIVRALMVRLTGEERSRFTRKYTGNLEAYQAYLRGRHFWEKRSPGGYQKAIECFERATLHDPRYALAQAGLADCYNLLACYSLMPPGEAWPRALAAAERAVAIDDRLPEAHSSLALARMGYEWNWKAAEEECLRALDLDPDYATARNYLAEWYTARGRYDESVQEIHRAQGLEPLSLILNRDVGAQLYYARRYDEAIEHLRDSLELSPDFALTHSTLAWALERKGLYEEAIKHVRAAIALVGPTSQFLGELGHSYAMAGDRVRTQKVWAEMESMATAGYVSPYHFALVCLGKGDHQRALGWLEKACEIHVWQVIYFPAEPKLDPVRSSPRFQALLRRAGLAQANSARAPFSSR
jgi:DNA-binding winged helix-turn-helix (wHTH) protein/tetratricopeptide (TPR) repeat protein